jgi:two-component sensor histidine kinase
MGKVKSGTAGLPSYLRAAEATEWIRAHPKVGYTIAIVASALATLVRFWVDPMLPTGFPYLTFFPAVILTAFFCGLGPGVLAAVLSGFAAWFFFMAPVYSFHIFPQTALALALYTFIVAVDIGLIHFMHRSAERLRAEQIVTQELNETQRVMFQELQHRVANNMQFVAGLLNLQRRQAAATPSEALAVIDESRARLETISRIHRRLYDPGRVSRPIGPYIQELCGDVIEATGANNVECVVDMPPIQLDLTRLTTVSLLVVELVTNSLKHAFEPEQTGTITVTMRKPDASTLVLSVADDGRGLQDERPGESRGLGWQIVQGLATQLQGELRYETARGAHVTLVFPAEG